MATITLVRGKTLPDTGIKADLHDLVDLTTATITNIVNADISASAAIAGTKISPNFGAQDIITSGNCDFNGNVDVDGTIETDAITLGGVAVDTAGGLGTYSTLVIKSIKDYTSSASTGTAKTQAALILCYGTVDVAPSGGSQAITNLPFTSATSYMIQVTYDSTAITSSEGGAISAVQNSGAQFTIYNGGNLDKDIHWLAIGT